MEPNKKPYQWFFFLEPAYELPPNHQEDIYFEAYKDPELQTWVAIKQSYGKATTALYYNIKDQEKAWAFHQTHHADKGFELVEQGPQRLSLEVYDTQRVLQQVHLFGFDAQRREVAHTIMNAQYEMTQYSESFYANEQTIDSNLEKIFYPSIWLAEEVDEF